MNPQGTETIDYFNVSFVVWFYRCDRDTNSLLVIIDLMCFDTETL